jgi:uncharacterized membrane protein YeaQ/YmgE (transglycosylase-associated protein family)
MPCSTYEEALLNKQHMGDRPWETFKQGEKEMNILIYLIAGAIVGYVASRIMKTNSQQGPLMDIVVGVVGALLAGYFISPLLGVGTINDAVTLPTMLVTLIGSIVLLWIYKMVAARR